ncbi:MAG: S-layer homology domain-containing protein, partial [Oscillospiraceae bacterium]|nr:S-layer homology domain-containing protein [Oscillospiraceae bacterium]
MKKFLSLVLALVMTMSLVTVSAGAAYKDADDIEYKEAVDVLSAIGVLTGDESGFRPNDTLKRSEAAKIIAYLQNGAKVAAGLTAPAAPFADVAANHWAAGYIVDLVDEGILSGVGDNKFNPEGKLTGFAYLKMLLVCLGYDASIEGFVNNSNWYNNVMDLADELELTKGNDDFNGNANVTREEAALYALN